MILKIFSCFFFFSKGWDIKHRFSQHEMADISLVLIFIFCAIVVIYKHNKLKQKRCHNGVRLRRVGGSLIVICLIQRELISVNNVN